MRKLGILENLIRVNRYSGTLLIKQESVSDHVWCMVTLALEYVPKLNDRLDESHRIDIRDVIYGICLHDIDEALTTDLPRPFKHANREIESAVEKTVDKILSDALDEQLCQDIKIAEDKSTPIGALIKIFDLAQAGYKMKSESMLGNKYFDSEITNVLDCLNGLYDRINDSKFDQKITVELLWLISQFLNDLDK